MLIAEFLSSECWFSAGLQTHDFLVPPAPETLPAHGTLGAH